MARRRLTRREFGLTLTALIVFLCIVTVPFARGFARNYREVNQELGAAARRLQQAKSLRETIVIERNAQQQLRDYFNRQGNALNLYDFVNRELASMGLQDRMRLQKRLGSDSQDAVELSLNNISMKELVDFLHTLNADGRLIAVQTIRHIRPARDDQGLDTMMILTAPKR